MSAKEKNHHTHTLTHTLHIYTNTHMLKIYLVAGGNIAYLINNIFYPFIPSVFILKHFIFQFLVFVDVVGNSVLNGMPDWFAKKTFTDATAHTASPSMLFLTLSANV